MDGFGYHELERAALGFVLEGETWPVFLAWVRQSVQEGRCSGDAEAWLDSGPDLGRYRQEWVAHTPVPDDLHKL